MVGFDSEYSTVLIGMWNWTWIISLDNPITTHIRIGIPGSCSIALNCFDTCVQQIIVFCGPSALSWRKKNMVSCVCKSSTSEVSWCLLLPVKLNWAVFWAAIENYRPTQLVPVMYATLVAQKVVVQTNFKGAFFMHKSTWLIPLSQGV